MKILRNISAILLVASVFSLNSCGKSCTGYGCYISDVDLKMDEAKKKDIEGPSVVFVTP